jgi:hypothetical protein
VIALQDSTMTHYFTLSTGQKIPEGPFLQEVRRRLEVLAGKREALLTFLEARGLEGSDADRAKLGACIDGATLDAWIRSAATATTFAQVLEAAPPPPPVKEKAPAKPRARKRATSKAAPGGQRRKRTASPP